MKKIILLTASVALIATCYGQQLPQQNTPVSQTDYLKKSKSQKIAAWIMLGTGATLIAIAAPGNVDLDVLPTLAFGGGGLIIGSIPLFIASGKNKRKAMNRSVGFKSEQLSIPFTSGSIQKSIPALAISIKL